MHSDVITHALLPCLGNLYTRRLERRETHGLNTHQNTLSTHTDTASVGGSTHGEPRGHDFQTWRGRHTKPCSPSQDAMQLTSVPRIPVFIPGASLVACSSPTLERVGLWENGSPSLPSAPAPPAPRAPAPPRLCYLSRHPPDGNQPTTSGRPSPFQLLRASHPGVASPSTCRH